MGNTIDTTVQWAYDIQIDVQIQQKNSEIVTASDIRTLYFKGKKFPEEILQKVYSIPVGYDLGSLLDETRSRRIIQQHQLGEGIATVTLFQKAYGPTAENSYNNPTTAQTIMHLPPIKFLEECKKNFEHILIGIIGAENVDSNKIYMRLKSEYNGINGK